MNSLADSLLSPIRFVPITRLDAPGFSVAKKGCALMVVAVQFVSLVISFSCISALAIPPLIVMLFSYRGRPPLKLVLPFLALMVISVGGALNEFRNQQVFFAFAAQEGYETKSKPFFYLSDTQAENFVKAYSIVFFFSLSVSLMAVILKRICRKQTTTSG